MSTAVSHDIRISVRSQYEAAHSDPKSDRYIHSYSITISNRGRETVKLLRRHWIIRDSLSPVREVEGPGVVGETPVLGPGEEFTYSSACDLRSGLGRMEGSYLMVRVSDGEPFRVGVPAFDLRFPWLAN